MIDKILTHNADALNRLLEQYKGKTNLKKVIEIYTKQVQDLEDAFYTFFLLKSIQDSEGAQLDLIGKVIGQVRKLGESDETYRINLAVKIGINTSEGELEKVISIFKIITGSEWVKLDDYENGNIGLTGNNLPIDQNSINLIFSNVERILLAGVRLLTIVDASVDDSFAFFGDNTVVNGKGFGSVSDAALGGKFAKLLQAKYDFAFSGSNPKLKGFGSVFDSALGGVLKSV